MRFQEWTKAWFDRPETDRKFWISDPPEELEPARELDYATLLFAKSGELLEPYSNTQIGNSLYGLIYEGSSPLYCLRDISLSLSNRVNCIRAIELVFRDVFAVRCSEKLGHLSEPGGALEGVCYMWWDIFPAYTSCFKETSGPVLEQAVLDVQTKVLALPHAACQESALHGLGHWQRNNKKAVETIVRAAVASGNLRRPELIAYAENANIGMVL